MADTIFALASGAGRAGVAVVRLSGPQAGMALTALAGTLPPARTAMLRNVAHAGAVLDQALLLWFPAPASFTGEDVAELHLHGGRAVRAAVFDSLMALGLRPAEPGEFSRRAVENGKLDLTRAEAIADLVDAETEAQRRQALRQYDGALADLYESWRAQLIMTLGRAEAAIDFSDDGVGDAEFDASRQAAVHLSEEIRAHLDDAGRGEALREGVRLAIIGPPNAGKSSLLNALARRDVAIVSDIAGTTRDVIEARLDLGGVLVIAADTAGLRASRDAIEAEGVRRALARAKDAHLTLLLLDANAAGEAAAIPGDLKPDLVVWNKTDLKAHDGISISLKTGAGVPAMLKLLQQKVQQKFAGFDPSWAPALTRPRHRAALVEALAALDHAGSAAEPELLAEDLRLAMRAVGRITGRVDVEEVLEFIFRDFCIGK
ncbi:MAG: tRNA uridine-5-carboxymethylaminomethyl(34) synthesis GTPase MnmE [Alphaproteobacteria bacterium]|nr:tRNA uridine-5-carboxymethylaminomethyl(34) synthesis GTPase MnmE [Alphaproteobacteria bacterium]